MSKNETIIYIIEVFLLCCHKFNFANFNISLLDNTQGVHPKGDQSCVFFGSTDAEAETTMIWPPVAKRWLIWKDPDAGKDWGQEEKGTKEDGMVGWHHWLSGHEFE